MSFQNIMEIKKSIFFKVSLCYNITNLKKETHYGLEKTQRRKR